MSAFGSPQQTEASWISACFTAPDMGSLATLVVDRVLLQTGFTAFFVGLVQPNEVVVRARVGRERPPAFVVQFLESQKYLGSHEAVKSYMAQVGVPWSNESRCLQIGSELVLVEPLFKQNGDAFAQVIVTDLPPEFAKETTVLETVQGVLAELIATASVGAWTMTSDQSSSDEARRFAERKATNTQMLVVESLLHKLNGSLATLSLMGELADFSEQKAVDDLRSTIRGMSRDLVHLDEAAVSWTFADAGGLLSSVVALLPMVTTDLRRHGLELQVIEAQTNSDSRVWISSVVTLRILHAILQVLLDIISSNRPQSQRSLEVLVEVTQATRTEIDITVMHPSATVRSTDQISAAIQRAMTAIELTATALGGSLAWNLDKGRTVLSFRR